MTGKRISRETFHLDQNLCVFSNKPSIPQAAFESPAQSWGTWRRGSPSLHATVAMTLTIPRLPVAEH